MATANPTEEWRSIKGYEDRYEVSERGRVRSHVYSEDRLLKCSQDSKGYPKVTLWVQGNGNCIFVHSLVLEAFVGPRPSGLFCDHLDGNPVNNCAGNLEWVTPAENVQRGKLAKLDKEEVRQIRKRHAEGVLQKELARRYCVSRGLISGIINRKLWVSITAD